MMVGHLLSLRQLVVSCGQGKKQLSNNSLCQPCNLGTLLYRNSNLYNWDRTALSLPFLDDCSPMSQCNEYSFVCVFIFVYARVDANAHFIHSRVCIGRVVAVAFGESAATVIMKPSRLRQSWKGADP